MSERIRARGDVLFTNIDAETGVLLDIRTKLYFSLNSTGAHLWQFLTGCENGEASRQQLAQSLEAGFEVTAVQAIHDVESWIIRLEELALIERV